MARVVTPGGTVAAYVWDSMHGGSPVAPIQTELEAMGFTTPAPPNLAAPRMEALLAYWQGAGLREIETREIVPTRTFADFDDFWTTTLTMPNLSPVVASMTPTHVAQLRATVQRPLSADEAGRIACSARANAIMGRVPD